LGTRYLNDGESILRKQKIKSTKAVGSEEIESLIIQSPNTRLFGLPLTHLVYLYEWGDANFDSVNITKKINNIELDYNSKIANADKNKQKKKLQSKKIRKLEKKNKKLKEGNLRMRWGEPLAVFDPVKLEESEKNLNNYLFTNGYFSGKVDVVEYLPSVRSNKGNAKSTWIKIKINPNKPSIIDSMIYDIKDPKVENLFIKNIQEQLLIDKKYDQDLISHERDRIFDLMTNHGYFDFKRQYVLFEVDSTILDNRRLIIREMIANPPNQNHHKIFTLDSVIFTTNPNNSFIRIKKPNQYNQITYQLNNNRFDERVIDWRIFVAQDSLYNKKSTLETQKQLSYLDMFKFVNITHDTTGGKFIANIFTSPLQKYQTSIEGGFSLLDQANGLPGPFFNFNAKNRNIFRGLEILEFNGIASIQGITSVNKDNTNFIYSRLQYGGAFTMTFPQFLFPVKDSYQNKIGQYNPKTKITFGINFEDRFSEYERTTFNASMGYSWQVSDNSQFTFRPLSIGYLKTQIDPNDTTFLNQLKLIEEAGNISYVRAFRSSFLSSSLIALDVNFNNYGITNQNATYLHLDLEYGGTAQSLFNLIDLVRRETNFKYIKTNMDFRQNKRLDKKTAFAYRANLGIAYTFGKSNALPYEKYYFAGGSNSIRAWQPRRLGPGNYAAFKTDSLGNATDKVNYDREQPGDILIELSAELRRDFIGIIDYALFIDAGNLWLWKSKTIEDSETTITNGGNGIFRINSFMSEIAVAAGAGLRLDFSFLVLRLDGAYKIFDPARSEGNRYVLDELNLRNLGPGGKMNLNIGIGYPF
jgi:outer membrane protein insertion porin family